MNKIREPATSINGFFFEWKIPRNICCCCCFFLLSNILYRLIIIVVRIEYDQTNRMFDLKYFHTNTYLELFLFPLSFTISVLSNKSKEAVSSIHS